METAIMTNHSTVYNWNKDNIKITETMAGHVSHHVNNPLMIILGKASMVSKNTKDLDTAKAMASILEQVTRLTEYTKYLENLSNTKQVIKN